MMFACNCNNLELVEKFLEKHILPKLAQEKTEIFKELYIHFQNWIHN